MIILYTSPGCASCRKAKKWLKEHNMKFVEKNIFTTLLRKDEIKYLLQKTENGTEDIISPRSKAFQAFKHDINDLTLDEVVDFIQKNPSVMRRPIIVDEKNFIVGYDEDEITTFLPSELRSLAEKECNANCPNYKDCEYIKDIQGDLHLNIEKKAANHS